MNTLRRGILGFIIVVICSITAVFFLHEGAQSALDAGIRKAQENVNKHLGNKDSGSKPEGSSEVTTSIGHENATLYTLCRNEELHSLLRAIDSVEEKFNKRFKYDWVFLNDDDFTSEFKEEVSEAVSGKAHFGKINSTMWGYPEWIDLDRAAETRKWMKQHNVVYGDLESYHHMCRFQSGFFFRHPLMENYKYAWRVEPGISILCKLKQDPFRLMRINNLAYGFNVAPQDIKETVVTLWNSTKKFVESHEEFVDTDNLKDFVTDDGGETYNLCHFWSNFEISDLDWLRSDAYISYFDFLDKEGGFYYERWGDAPLRSIAASLFLPKNKIYFFNDIGYYHAPYGHCPYDQGPSELECDCNPGDSEFSNKFYDYHKNSCMRRYFQAKGRSYHDRNPDQKEGN